MCLPGTRALSCVGPPRASSRLSQRAVGSEEKAEPPSAPVDAQITPSTPPPLALPHLSDRHAGEHSERRLVLPNDAPHDDLPAEPVRAIMENREKSEQVDASAPISPCRTGTVLSSVFSPDGTALDVYEELSAEEAAPQPSPQREPAARRREQNYSPSMRTPVATRSRTRAEQSMANVCGVGSAILMKRRPLSLSSYVH